MKKIYFKAEIAISKMGSEATMISTSGQGADTSDDAKRMTGSTGANINWEIDDEPSQD